MKVLNEPQAFPQPRVQSEFSTKRILAEEQIKTSSLIGTLIMPIGIGHGDLVEVGHQCPHNAVGLLVVMVTVGAVAISNRCVVRCHGTRN